MSIESDHKGSEYIASTKDELGSQAASLRQLVEETLMHKGEEMEPDSANPKDDETRYDVGLQRGASGEPDFSKQILERIEADELEERLKLETPLEENELNMEDLTEAVEALCLSKAEEFALLGYDQVIGEEIWECVSTKYKAGYPALHVIINDILSLKADKFMNWLLIRSYRS